MRTIRWIAILFGLCLAVGIVVFFLTTPKGPGSVRRVNRPDSTLLAAIGQAKTAMPLFLEELNHPRANQKFAVMGAFTTPNGNEYLWIKDPAMEGSKVAGILDQVPISAPLHKGDRVSIALDEVVDWMIREPDGKIRGKFTETANQ